MPKQDKLADMGLHKFKGTKRERRDTAREASDARKRARSGVSAAAAAPAGDDE